jgi:hypothetical protein
MLGFFLILNSIFNSYAKGFIYLGGVLIASVINILVMTLIKSPISENAASSCNLITFPMLNTSLYNSPAFNSMFIAFTSSYIISPMLMSTQVNGMKNDAKINFPIIATLAALFMIDALSKTQNDCTTVSGVAFGGLLGLTLGFMWYSILRMAGADNLVYTTNYYSNKETCGVKSQQFICVDG